MMTRNALLEERDQLREAAKLALKYILDEAEARDYDPPADTLVVAELEAAIAGRVQ